MIDSTAAVCVVRASSELPMCSKATNSGKIESINSFVKNIFDVLKHVIDPIQKIIVVKNLLQIVNLPVILKDIIKKSILFNEMSRTKKTDASLNFCNQIREIGEAVGTFVVTLEKIKAISEITEKWAVPFSATISALSICSIISKIRTCLKVMRFRDRLASIVEHNKVDGKVTLAGYQGMLYHIEKKQRKDEDFLGEMFNNSEEKLSEALVSTEIDIQEKLSFGNASAVKEGQIKLENSIAGLKGRLNQNLVSSALTITTATTNIIGTILLLTLPLLPLGWAFLGLGVVCDIGRIVHHKIGEYQFSEAIGLKRNYWELLTC